MKGIIFNVFNSLVEEKFGLETWDQLIEKTKPKSKGVYTAVGTYPDSEMMDYVSELSKITRIEPSALVVEFGKYTAKALHSVHGEFFEGHDLKSFLKSIDSIVHVEVKKIHPEAVLPKFETKDISENELLMIYQSKRKLCALAEGLILGSASIFKEEIEVTQSQCVHQDGGDTCHIHIKWRS